MPPPRWLVFATALVCGFLQLWPLTAFLFALGLLDLLQEKRRRSIENSPEKQEGDILDSDEIE